MAKSLHEYTEEFKLIDLDNLIDDLIIPEPSNFGSIRLSIKRDPEDRGGVNFEFGDETSSLGFDRNAGVYSAIQEILTDKGSDANIRLDYSILEDGEYSKLYEAHIVPSSSEEKDYEIVFRLKRTDFGDKFRTRYNVDIDIESNTDLDGNTILSLDTLEIPMHSKTVEETGVINSLIPGPFDAGVLLGIGISYQFRVLNGISAFNSVEKNYENLILQPDVAFLIDTNGGLVNDQERYVDKNQLYLNDLPIYRAQGVSDSISLDMKQTIRFELETTGLTQGGSAGDFDEIRFFDLAIWIVNGGQLKQVLQNSITFIQASSYNQDISWSYSSDLDLDQGDEIFYGYSFGLGGSNIAPLFNINSFTTESIEGYVSVISKSKQRPTLCRGGFIFDVLNKLLQKAVGSTSVGEIMFKTENLTGVLSQGDIVVGSLSNATGTISSVSGSFYVLVNIRGSFSSGDLLEGPSGSVEVLYMTVGMWQNGWGDGRENNILKSSILEKEGDNFATSDGCASLNFITDGLAIRDFLDKEYESDKYYRKGDKVKYLDRGFVYINDLVSKNVDPSNSLYWEPSEGHIITTTIKKIVDFVKFRYGAGVALIKEKGVDYGSLTNEKVTRLLIERHSYFFQDKEISRFESIEDNLIRRTNKQIIFNSVEAGYSIFAEANDSQSLNGFNTVKNVLTPIEKDVNKLNLVADVCTDGEEFERLKRIKFSDSPSESDSKDTETCIVDCIRIDENNLLDPELYGDVVDILSIVIFGFSDGRHIREIRGLILNQLQAGDKLVTVGTGGTFEYIIESIYLDFENNKTVITLPVNSTTDVGTFVTFDPFYFKNSNDVSKSIFIPRRVEGFSNILNSSDPLSEYNINHVPSNFLVNNFSWFGSGLRAKKDEEYLKYLSGKNNVEFRKEYNSDICEPIQGTISENSNYSISSLRQWNPAIFDEYEYSFSTYVSFKDFERIRKALVFESDEDINGGFVTIPDNHGDFVQVYPVQVDYDKESLRLEVTAWGKA